MIEIITVNDRYPIADELGPKVLDAIANKRDYITINGAGLIKVSGIMEVKYIQDKPKAYLPATPALPAPSTALTEERRQANIDRIREMKRTFMERRTGADPQR